MSIVEVDNRGRILLNKRLRKKYKITPGGKVLLIESAEGILVKPVDLSLDRLSKILRKIKWGRESRRRAEEWLLKQVKKS